MNYGDSALGSGIDKPRGLGQATSTLALSVLVCEVEIFDLFEGPSI